VGGPAPAELPPGALTGRYEVIHERHTPAPPYEAAGDESLIFINCMEFEPGREQEAFDFWLRVNDYMVNKPGYRWHRLHRRLDPTAPFGQINVVEWESVESWEAARDDGFRALTMRPDIPFVPVATLCRPVAGQPAGA
jgi:heme-degrading monooxygenase HmoA